MALADDHAADDDVLAATLSPPPALAVPLNHGTSLRRTVAKHANSFGIDVSIVDLAMAPTAAAAATGDVVAWARATWVSSLKTLCSDFVVRERRALDGEPLVLRSLRVVDEEAAASAPAPAAMAAECRGGSGPNEVSAAEEAARTELRGLLCAENAAVLDDFCQDVTKPQVTLPVLITDKPLRSRIHQLVKTMQVATGRVRKPFTKVDSRTGPDGCIQLHRVSGGGDGSNQGGGGDVWRTNQKSQQQQWPATRAGEFLHFTLWKQNIDTASAIRQIAAKINIAARNIQFSGNKDKRAVTLQRLAVRLVDAKRIAGLNNTSFGRGAVVKLGDYEYRKDGLVLGNLRGNGFEIVARLRRRDTSDSIGDPDRESHFATHAKLRVYVSQVEATLSACGFVNYFGPQRFGTTDVPTCAVGAAIMAGKYDEAVCLILKSKSYFVPDMQVVAEIMESHCAALREEKKGNGRSDMEAETMLIKRALDMVPHFCFSERDLLVELQRNPRNFEGAVLKLPRPLSMLFCHSVQSLIWNRVASRRLQLRGTTVHVGDLVCLRSPDKDDNSAAAALSPSEAHDRTMDSEGASAMENTDLLLSGDLATATGNDEDLAADGSPSSLRSSVHLVTERDVADNRFSILDVLLPVPGPDADLLWPTMDACSHRVYVDMLAELGITGLLSGDKPGTSGESTANDDRRAQHLAKRFHFHGTYRRLMIRPERLSIELVAVRDDISSGRVADLMLSDLDKLDGVTDDTTRGGASLVPSLREGTTIDVDAGSPANPACAMDTFSWAVVARFLLPAGSYATSLMREVFEDAGW